MFKIADCEGGICGHAVLALGYQDDPSVEGGGYLIIQNSWGENWGSDGYAFLTYEWAVNSILDAQAIVRIESDSP